MPNNFRDVKPVGQSGKPFSQEAVSAFERTYRALFEQAHIEVDRLEKTNAAMRKLETALLDPERIEEMDVGQQIALAELLGRTSQGSIGNLMRFSNLFMNIRTVVGLLDGVQKFTAIQNQAGQFPGLPRSGDDG